MPPVIMPGRSGFGGYGKSMHRGYGKPIHFRRPNFGGFIQPHFGGYGKSYGKPMPFPHFGGYGKSIHIEPHFGGYGKSIGYGGRQNFIPGGYWKKSSVQKHSSIGG